MVTMVQQTVLGKVKEGLGLGEGELQQGTGELRDREGTVGTNVNNYRTNNRHGKNCCRQTPKEVVSSRKQKIAYM
jgi:hypothetical protein